MFGIFIPNFNDRVLQEYERVYRIREEVLEWFVIFADKAEYFWSWDRKGCYFYFDNKNDAMLFKLTWY